MSLKVVSNAVTKEETTDHVPAKRGRPSAKDKVDMKKAKTEEKLDLEDSEINISDGQVINLKFKRDSYFFEVMRKLSQKRDLLNQIDGWKTKTKKAKDLIKDLDTDLDAIDLHFERHKNKVK